MRLRGIWSRGSRLLLPLLVGALVLTGCTQHPAEQSNTLWLGPQPLVGTSELEDGWTRFSGRDGLFVTPTVALQVAQVKRADTLTAEDCEILDCSAADPGVGEQDPEHGITALDGRDLVAVVLRAPQVQAPYPGLATSAKLRVVGGEVPRELAFDELMALQSGSFVRFVMAMPDDTENLHLEVRMGGRRMSFDLLSGEPAKDADTRLVAPLRDVRPQPIEPQSYRATALLEAISDGPTRFRSAFSWRFGDSLRWSPWNPADGWAPKGSAWLTLGEVSAGVDPKGGYGNVYDAAFTLDMRRSVTVRPKGRAPRLSDGGRHRLYVDQPVTQDLQWKVPADSTSGTLQVRTAADVEVFVWDAEERTSTARWVEATKPLRFAYDLRAD